MSFFGNIVSNSIPVEYVPPPKYTLTIRTATLLPDSLPCHLYVKTENVDGKIIELLLGTLRPFTSEQLKLDLVFGYPGSTSLGNAGCRTRFSVSIAENAPGTNVKNRTEAKVAIAGFIEIGMDSTENTAHNSM